jgi:hypothetical protein
MRQTAAPRSSLDALDQWGIRFPLLPDDLAELVQPTPSSLAQAISSWRLSLPTLLPSHGDALDQWGIEFPITYDELAAFGANCRGGRSQARTSAILDGRLRGISRFGASAAIVAILVAGSASAVPSPASAGAPPTRDVPVLIVVAAEQPSATSNPTLGPTLGPTPGPTLSTEPPSATSNPTLGPTLGPTPGPTLPAEQPSATSNPTLGPTPTSNPTLGPTPTATLPTEQPSPTSNPTLGPTPTATLPAEALGIKPVANIPAPVVLETGPVQVGLFALPTIQDARNYLVARLGTGIDRHWGRSQSQCASLIFEYEARWDPHATNKSSGAYGLAQAYPASKLANWAEAKAKAAVAAGDPDAARLYRAWRDNPVAQAEWGVDYMTGRYGSPCSALAFRNGYWQGGVLIPGVGWY